jgi:hypothetical protein
MAKTTELVSGLLSERWGVPVLGETLREEGPLRHRRELGQ